MSDRLFHALETVESEFRQYQNIMKTHEVNLQDADLHEAVNHV